MDFLLQNDLHLPIGPLFSLPVFDLVPVYHDESLIIVNKPAGLLAVPGRGEDKQDCVANRLQKLFPDALVVHRLDMATSGLMVFARNQETQRKLSHMFREREVEKLYLARVLGRVGPHFGTIDLPISADWPNRPLRKIDPLSGKPSLTRFRVLGFNPPDDQFPENTLIELQPVTGRTHQLRVHMAAIGHPIIGDALYGSAQGERMMLHACSLRFTHPSNGVLLAFQSPAVF